MARILYVNANGITGKTRSLKTALAIHQTNIANITETRAMKQPKIVGYIWYHKPRNTRTGGGVGILIADDIQDNINQLELPTHEDHEIIKSE